MHDTAAVGKYTTANFLYVAGLKSGQFRQKQNPQGAYEARSHQKLTGAPVRAPAPSESACRCSHLRDLVRVLGPPLIQDGQGLDEQTASATPAGQRQVGCGKQTKQYWGLKGSLPGRASPITLPLPPHPPPFGSMPSSAPINSLWERGSQSSKFLPVPYSRFRAGDTPSELAFEIMSTVQA